MNRDYVTGSYYGEMPLHDAVEILIQHGVDIQSRDGTLLPLSAILNDINKAHRWVAGRHDGFVLTEATQSLVLHYKNAPRMLDEYNSPALDEFLKQFDRGEYDA